MAFDTFSKPYDEMFRKGGWWNDYDFTLADNEATSIEANYVGELVFMWSDANAYALAFLTAGNGSSSAQEISSHSGTDILSGTALTGTDGSGGMVSISANDDGKYYIENQGGSTMQFHVRILS